ncbi:hypothetical protein U0839_08770, partial [Commensalibacter sp. A3DC]
MDNRNQINTNSDKLMLDIQGDILNHSGSILTKNNDLSLTAKGKIDNSSGQIGSLSKGDVTV